MIDTHAHLDCDDYAADRAEVIARCREAGIEAIGLPGVDYPTSVGVVELARQYKGYLYPMVGIHPEEVKDDYLAQLDSIRPLVDLPEVVAIGEVGLDYYFTREREREQLDAFERQIIWSCESGKPLMLHVRKAQNEALRLLRRYEKDLPGGVFHCFSGNAIEARQVLQLEKFSLGIGGILTFKKSTLPATLAEAVPLDRIVLETDAPWLAPVPVRGTRNDSSRVPYIAARLAEIYGVTVAEISEQTDRNARRIFGYGQ